MDIVVKLSLAGGHRWEFVCDEDDALVAGIVSALPGATADASLPPDGLIQVESRSGERLFLTRSSLVAVSISRAPTTFGAFDQGRIGRRVKPTDYVHVQSVLSSSAIAELVGLAKDRAPIAAAAPEIELPALPAAVIDDLIAAVAAAARDLGVEPAVPSHLDVRLFPAMPDLGTLVAAKPEPVLHMVVPLSAENLAMQIADSVSGGEEPGETGEGRALVLKAGEGLAVVASAAARVGTSAPAQTGMILMASLCLGERRAAG